MIYTLKIRIHNGLEKMATLMFPALATFITSLIKAFESIWTCVSIGSFPAVIYAIQRSSLFFPLWLSSCPKNMYFKCSYFAGLAGYLYWMTNSLLYLSIFSSLFYLMASEDSVPLLSTTPCWIWGFEVLSRDASWMCLLSSSSLAGFSLTHWALICLPVQSVTILLTAFRDPGTHSCKNLSSFPNHSLLPHCCRGSLSQE